MPPFFGERDHGFSGRAKNRGCEVRAVKVTLQGRARLSRRKRCDDLGGGRGGDGGNDPGGEQTGREILGRARAFLVEKEWFPMRARACLCNTSSSSGESAFTALTSASLAMSRDLKASKSVEAVSSPSGIGRMGPTTKRRRPATNFELH